ncbi:hypothetical protein MD484_g8251, partial [Candolleomyces efflorescens]
MITPSEITSSNVSKLSQPMFQGKLSIVMTPDDNPVKSSTMPTTSARLDPSTAPKFPFPDPCLGMGAYLTLRRAGALKVEKK